MKNQTHLTLLNDGSFTDSTQEALIKRLIETDNFQHFISQHYMHSPANQHDYKWWQWVIFVQKSWRLTAVGFTFFNLHFKTFQVHNEANNLISGHIIRGLNDVIRGPWLIRRHIVYTWNPDIYFELKMFDGNVNEFLLFKDQKNC